MLQLSDAMLEKLNITPGREVVFSCGSIKFTAVVTNRDTGTNCLSRDAHTLNIGCLRGINQPLALFFNERENELKIGPVVAVLSGIPVMFLAPEVVSLYRTIAVAARDAGMLFYVFTPDLINFANGTVNGFYYSPYALSHNGWIMREFPLPDIIYNQAGFISDELKPMYRKLLLEYLQEHINVKLVNPFLALNDKLATHKILWGDQLAKDYIPETRDCACTADILAMLQKYDAVHLKPCVSSLGRGVLKVSLQDNGSFMIQFHRHTGKKITEIIRGEDALSARLQPLLEQQPYLVQQSIPLIQYENRPVDFRVHLFKNEQGRWECLVVKARLGPVAGVVTGLAGGGFRLAGDKLLGKLFPPAETRLILGDIEATTLMLAQALERLLAKEFGELGFDMGVDGEGKVWMIEVNPKPNWNVPPEVNVVKEEQKLAAHFLGYCRYLLNLNTLSGGLETPFHSRRGYTD